MDTIVQEGSLLWSLIKLFQLKQELSMEKISGFNTSNTVEIKIYDIGLNQTRIDLITKG